MHKFTQIPAQTQDLGGVFMMVWALPSAQRPAAGETGFIPMPPRRA